MLAGGYYVDQASGVIAIERYVVAGLILALWSSTFVSRRVRRHVDWIALAAALMGVWLFCYFIYDTQLSAVSAATAFGMCFVGALMLRRQRSLTIWCVVTALSFAATAAAIEAPDMAVEVFVITAGFITIATATLANLPDPDEDLNCKPTGS